MPFFQPDEAKKLDEITRADAPGSFVQLSDGVTHYELSGNESGPVVVLIHGFLVPYFIYDPTFTYLTAHGFRVLRYDLFGRGFSDRPHVRYNLDLFVRQLFDLLDALRVSRPVNLIGLSMGGIIASAFAVEHVARVSKLVLIDPAGARPVELPPMLKVMKLPLVPEAILRVVGTGALIRGAAKDFFDPQLVDHFIAQYRVQLQYQGFGRAILSTLRNGMLDSFIHVYRTLGKLNIETLLLWGRNDITVPFEHSDDLQNALPRGKFRVIENCGHIPHYENPEEVNPILLGFLKPNEI